MAYLTFYIVITICVVLSKRWKGDFLYFFVCFVIVAFSAFRYETGFDWPIYDKYISGQIGTIYFPFFELLKYLFNLLELDKKFFYFFISILGNSLLLIAASQYFRQYRFIFVLFYVLWSDFYLIHSFSILRQFICLAFILFAFSRKINGKKFGVYLLLAMLTHHSALLYFMFSWSLGWLSKLKFSLAWLLYVLFSMLFFFNISIVNVFAKFTLTMVDSEYFLQYMNDTFNASIPLKLVIIVSLGFILNFAMKSFEASQIKIEEYSFCLIYIFISLIFYSFPTITTRIGFFFIFPVIKVVVLYLQRVVFLQRLLVKLVLVLILSFSNYRFYSSPLNITYFPYQTWLMEDDVQNSTGLERTQKVYDQLNELGVF